MRRTFTELRKIMGDKEERFTTSNCKNGDEPLSRDEVRVKSELLKEFSVQVRVHHESVLSPLIFVIAVDLIAK